MGQKLDAEQKRAIAEALWNEHGSAVYRFALRLTGNRSTAEDLTSETILAAIGAIGRVEVHRGYLFGITVNRWRKIRRIATEPVNDLLASDAIHLDELIDLERAYRLLPRKLQEAFVLVKAEGFTSKEAAEILGVPQGTVQARVHEAVQKIRHEVGIDALVPTLQEANL